MSTTLVASEIISEPMEQTHDQIAYNGLNRRATSMLPQTAESNRLKALTISHYQSILLSIQDNAQSGCLQIESETNRSRSAVLIFRGRILGCIYGKQGLARHVFNEAAYRLALQDLVSPEHSVTIYPLNEELVIAAGALFHGNTIEISQYSDSIHIFDFAHDTLAQFNMPGTISIVGGSDVSMCMVYIFGGRIVGVHSDKTGWTEPTYAAVKRRIAQNPTGVHVRACMLSAHNTDEVNQLTFNVSGVSGRKRSAAEITHSLLPALPADFQLTLPTLPKLRPFSSAIDTERYVPRCAD